MTGGGWKWFPAYAEMTNLSPLSFPKISERSGEIYREAILLPPIYILNANVWIPACAGMTDKGSVIPDLIGNLTLISY